MYSEKITADDLRRRWKLIPGQKLELIRATASTMTRPERERHLATLMESVCNLVWDIWNLAEIGDLPVPCDDLKEFCITWQDEWPFVCPIQPVDEDQRVWRLNTPVTG